MTEEALFSAALELTEPGARCRFIAQACGNDAALCGRIMALLRSHEEAGNFLAMPPDAVATLDTGHCTEQPGTIIDRYKLLQQIGEGGFGTVWMAEQTEPVSRRVALKVIKLGMDTREVIARFEAERQALAMMDHPNIAKVLDAGATGAGRPYFVMELVKGIPITQYCDQRQLSLRERLALFGDVCSAINHAHQKGVIHRDIKPSNVMVTLHGDKPVVKVIDFGVAKATQGKLTDKTLFTRFEQFIGTPVYMSPEQASLSGLDVDTRSDIYALGILLYELLTGKPPFDSKSLAAAGHEEMRRIIREVEPPRPSVRLSTIAGDERTQVAKARHLAPEKLGRLVEADLDWIVMKAIDKDRSRRYETANGLALDIQRFLSDEPVSATPPSAGYQLRKFARRNKTALRVAAGIAAVLVVATAVSSWQAVRATRAEKRTGETLGQVARERDAKELARKDAESIAAFLSDIFQSPDPKRDGRTIRVVELLDKAAKKLETDLADQPERTTKLQATLADTYWALGLARQAIPLQEQVLGFRRKALGPKHPDTLRAMGDLAASYFDAGRREEAIKLREDVLTLYRKVLGPEHPDTLEAMNNVALSYFASGRRDEAIKMQEEVLTLRRKLNGPEHPDTLTAMNNLAAYYFAAGRRDEAIKMQEEVLTLRRKVNGPEHPDTLMARNNLSGYYFAAGRRDEAIKMQEEVLTLRRKVNGPEHPDTLMAMSNLSTSYFAAGRRDEAIKMQEEVLTLRRKVLGAEHPDTFTAMNDLALSYFHAGRRDEALKMGEEVLTLRRKVLGPEHPNTLAAMNNLSGYCFAAGRRDEAIKMQEEALTLYRKVNGPEHPDTIAAMNNLALFYFDAGRRDEALKMREEVLPLCRKVLGSEHPDTLQAMGNLATSCFDAGRRDEAIKMQEQVLTLRRKVNGPEHPDTLMAMNNLAFSDFAAGRRDEAIKMQEEVLTLYRKVLGPEHPDTFTAMNNLAFSDFHAGRRDEAIKMREEVLTLRRKVLGPEHPDTLTAMENLAVSYAAAGRRDEAIKMQEEVLPLCRKVLGPEHPDTLQAMGNLATSCFAAGRRDEAIKMQEEVLPLYRKVLGPEHPDTLTAMENLGVSYAAAGRRDEALKMREEVLPLYRKVLGPEHPDTLKTLAEISEAYLARAANQAWFGQEEALGVTCDKVLELAKDANDAKVAERASKACSLRKSDLRRHAAALVLATRAVELGQRSAYLPYFQMALGMAEYRSGHYAEADAALLAAERGGKRYRRVPATSSFYRAMALFQQGKPGEARALLAATEAMMEPFPADEKNPLTGKGTSHDDLILWMACKEAQELLKGHDEAPAK